MRCHACCTLRCSHVRQPFVSPPSTPALVCLPASPCSWTQQLDGILVSSADGTLTMWHLRPRASPSVPEQQALLPPGSASGPAAASLRAAWSVHTPVPQRLVCAGVSVYAPSATAAGLPSGSSSAASSPAKDAAAHGGGSAASSPVRDAGEAARYASVWWPQHREQRQRHYAGGMPAVGQEKLRHPSAVVGALTWSCCCADHPLQVQIV